MHTQAGEHNHSHSLVDTHEMVMVSSNTPQYPVVTAANALPPWETCSIKHHLHFAGKHSATLQLQRTGCSYTQTQLSTDRYSSIQLTELEKCRMKKESFPVFLLGDCIPKFYVHRWKVSILNIRRQNTTNAHANMRAHAHTHSHTHTHTHTHTWNVTIGACV